MTEAYKIAIVGAGPGGISAAARAAELGISHLLLESEAAPANTVRKFQRGKHVMAEPAFIPLRSSISFTAGPREKVLKTWSDELADKGVNLRLNARVTAITGAQGGFEIQLADGGRIAAEFVILAIGVQGNIRKLGVPGDQLQMVQYQLDDPGAFVDETIVVVGAGDSAIENALALTEKNRVILLNRNLEFTRCNADNLALLDEAVDGFMIEVRNGSRIVHADAIKEGGFSLRLTLDTPDGPEQIACHRVIARLGANPPRALVEAFGVRFPSDSATAVPQLSPEWESNVKGMYIVGALSGSPLIKHAINQGYEVVEHILGHAVESADEALLKVKLADLGEQESLDDKLAAIREKVPLLSTLNSSQLREFLLESEILRPADHAFLFRHTDFNTSFFTLLEGEVTLVDQGQKCSLQLLAGDFFGETSLLSGRSSSEAARAGIACLLIETPRRAMLNLLNRDSSVRDRLQEKSLERLIQSFFELPMPGEMVETLVSHAVTVQFEAGADLYRENTSSDRLYLIRKGAVTVSRNDEVLAFLQAGQAVGEHELISQVPRASRARAAAATEVVTLDYALIHEVLSGLPELRRHLNERHLHFLRSENSRIAAPSLEGAVQRTGQSDEIFSVLMSQDVGEATDVLLIDYTLCIRCDSCEKACADTHGGTARLKREAGPTYGHLHVPLACRHCQQPECIKDCPPNAIRRSVNGEIFINESCIGCGNCVKNCPYDAIELHPPMAEQPRPGLFGMLIDLALGRDASPPERVEGTAKKAVKCDLCNSLREGPACVRACPTGAAARVRPDLFFNLARKARTGGQHATYDAA